MTDDGYAGNPELRRALRDADGQAARLTEMRRRLDEAVGHGTAADGRIAADYTNADGLAALAIDPRLFRLGSDEVGEQVRAAVNAAILDHGDQLRALSREAFGGVSAEGARDLATDPGAVVREVERLGDGFAGQLRDLVRDLGVQQRRAHDAASRLRPPEQP